MNKRIFIADLGLGWTLYAASSRVVGYPPFYALHESGRRVNGLLNIRHAMREIFEEALD